MKKFGWLFFVLSLGVSGIFAKQTIVVKNSLGFDRKTEVVEICVKSLNASFDKKTYVLTNEKEEEVGYQLICNGNIKPVSLIFQADVKANGSTSYTLSEGKRSQAKTKTSGRFVPDRKDDFAWENDLAAFRMYGPALAKENPSNGVDLWLKSTDELVVEQRYNDELKNGLSYHIDRGKGLDCYTVGHTLGAGGIAPYADGKLWVGNHYDSYKVIETGALRTVFCLTYDSVKVGNEFCKQTLTITTTAGSMLNKGVVKYIGKAATIELATGIFLHDGKGVLKQNISNGTMAYAEDAVSNAKVPAGRNYVGVYMPGKAANVLKDSEHGLIKCAYKIGDSYTYYFGGGWSKWHFPTDEDWFTALNQFAEKNQHPLQVKIK